MSLAFSALVNGLCTLLSLYYMIRPIWDPRHNLIMQCCTFATNVYVDLDSDPVRDPLTSKFSMGLTLRLYQCSIRSRLLNMFRFPGCVVHRIRSIQNDQQAIRDSSVIFVAPYWSYRISCLKVQLAPLAQGADSEKWNIGLDLCKKRRRMERIFEFV